jgi:hypothetical protein
VEKVQLLNIRPRLIEQLETLLEDAKAGRINDLLVLGSGWDKEGRPSYFRASYIDLGTAMAAFEFWKLRHLAIEFKV